VAVNAAEQVEPAAPKKPKKPKKPKPCRDGDALATAMHSRWLPVNAPGFVAAGRG
jgi:hypothetical protein